MREEKNDNEATANVSPTMCTHTSHRQSWNQSIEIHLTPIQGQIVLSYAITGNHNTRILDSI